MNTLSIASASVAALVAVTMFDAKPAEARKGFSFSSSRAAMSGRSVVRSKKTFSVKSFRPKLTVKPKLKLAPRRLVGSKVKLKTVGKIGTKSIGPKLKTVGKINKGVLNKKVLSKGVLKVGPAAKLTQTKLFKPAKLNLATLPKHKGVLGKANLVGRLAVPKVIKPKLALGIKPKLHLKHAFLPFIQRHWKKSFFWVAVAGIGYVTVPEIYYDRFHDCSYRYDPDYDECVRILSYAAVEEDSVGRSRHAMPATATYRYKAKAQPTRDAAETCSLEPFVERKWNREFVWVQIPETGNVTVPEEVYDTFQDKVDGEPPDYVAACKVLVDAAAADTVVATTAMDLGRNL